MKNISESVFDDIYSSKKEEIKEIVPQLKSSEIILDDEDSLVFKVNYSGDISVFPELNKDYYDFDSANAYRTAQIYVIYTFEGKSVKSGVIFVYANGNFKKPNDLDDFNKTYLLKPKSMDEISTLPKENIVKAYQNDKIDLNGFDFEFILELIAIEPEIITKLKTELYNDAQLTQMIKAHPKAKRYFSKSVILRLNKANLSDEEREAYDSQDMFVYLAKDKFKEEENGMYSKDLEIENLYKIDQYEQESQQAISMMQLRARFQQDVEMFILTTNKGLIDEVLGDAYWKINDDQYKWLRDAIRQHSKPIGQVQRKSL